MSRSENTNIDYRTLELDKTLPEMLYLQLSRQLYRNIMALPPYSGIKLLSERKLAELLEIDRVTVHRAYQELLKSGVIEQPSPRTFRVVNDVRCKQRPPFPNIGLVVPYRFSTFINRPGFYPLNYINGIMDRAAELNFSTTMLQLPLPDAPDKYVEKYMENVVERLTGVIHFGGRAFENDVPLQRLLHYDRIPQICISCYHSLPNVGAIVDDAATGGNELCRYMLKLRHDSIGVITPLDDAMHQDCSGFCYESLFRYKVMLECFAQNHIDCPAKWQLIGCRSRDILTARLKKLAENKNMPKVFWCSNDETAESAMRILNDLGYSVPEDVSLVGFDHIAGSPTEDFMTSIRLPFYEIGAKSVDLLREYYEQGMNEKNSLVRLPTTLVVKKSLVMNNTGNMSEIIS